MLNFNVMTIIAQSIEKDLQELSVDEMLALHEKLLAAIDEKENAQNIDPFYTSEVEKRIKEIDAGGLEKIDAFLAIKEM